MQVTLEKIALLDPVFDTVDTVGTWEEVGDPVPVEETTVVKITLVCMYVCMYVKYIDLYVYEDVDANERAAVMFVSFTQL